MSFLVLAGGLDGIGRGVELAVGQDGQVQGSGGSPVSEAELCGCGVGHQVDGGQVGGDGEVGAARRFKRKMRALLWSVLIYGRETMECRRR